MILWTVTYIKEKIFPTQIEKKKKKSLMEYILVVLLEWSKNIKIDIFSIFA